MVMKVVSMMATEGKKAKAAVYMLQRKTSQDITTELDAAGCSICLSQAMYRGPNNFVLN